MPSQYKCTICDSKPDQLSHHKSHLKTSKHKDKKELFKLQLEKLTAEELQEKYKTNKIENIIKTNETYIMDEKYELSKKSISGNIVWNLETNKDINPNYNTIKSELDSVIKKCHDLLYGKGGSIVGSKAQNDIMKILCLKILQPQFNDKESPLYNRCLLVKTKMNISEKQFEKYMLFCCDLDEITKLDDIMKEWKLFIQKFISNVFPSIYFENDEKFNCNKCTCISDLFHYINLLEITEKFKDAFSTTCGDIHESFREYGGRKGARELGQYFTPRQLIHLIFYGIGLDKLVNKISNITIYDPCMGTGGFLTRLFKLCDIQSHNIYGCETESDTIKFGNMSMVLTTGSVENNIIKCDSLCENPFIVDKKFSVIVTNPPFGTKIKYDEVKKTFEETITDVKFEDVYPLKTNNGACLFIQHCVYMLQENGVCAIVLPDGELFEGNSKWSKEFRKWWTNNVNIQTILKVPSGTFEHTGVKTNVVVFVKNGPTQNIQFMETTKECNMVKDMFTITMDELIATDYSLDVGEYLVEETDVYDVPMVELGDVCEIVNGTRIVKKDNIRGQYPVYGSGEESFTTTTYNREGDVTIIGRFALSEKCVRIIKNTKLFLNDSAITIDCESLVTKKYISYYLLFNQNIIYEISRGQAQRNLNMEKLRNLKIPLPSLEVQQQIVDELSMIETSIQTIGTRLSQLNKEKEQYKKYGRKADIQELLKGCESRMLGDVCEFQNGYSFKSNDYEKHNETNIGIIQIKSIKNGCIDENKITEYIEENKKYKLFEIQKGDILLALSGATAGKMGIYNLEKKSYLNQRVGKINSKTGIIQKYIYYWYICCNIDKKILNLAKGTAQPNISTNVISNIKIPIPTLDIQQQCIELFEQKETYIQCIDDKIAQEKKYIEELKQLAKDIISSHC